MRHFFCKDIKDVSVKRSSFLIVRFLFILFSCTYCKESFFVGLKPQKVHVKSHRI